MVGAVSAIGLVYLATAVWLHQKKQGITNLCIYHVTWAAFFLGTHFQHLNTFALCELSKKSIGCLFHGRRRAVGEGRRRGPQMGRYVAL